MEWLLQDELTKMKAMTPASERWVGLPSETIRVRELRKGVWER